MNSDPIIAVLLSVLTSSDDNRGITLDSEPITAVLLSTHPDDYRGISVDSCPHHRGVVVNVDLVSVTTAVIILIQTPIPRLYPGIRGIIVNTVLVQVSATNQSRSLRSQAKIDALFKGARRKLLQGNSG